MARALFVKICGVTTEEDALLVAAMGADAVGMVFAASSRRITAGVARDIVRRLPPEVLSVGVFRDESRERVVETANTIGLRVVQLHGHESAEDTRWVAERVPNVIRAFSIADPSLEQSRLAEFGSVALLIDSPMPGSGEAFDWESLDQLSLRRPFLLAGGLEPTNVAAAVETVRPWGVDVSSGVEARPGVKDPVKVQRFIANARHAHAVLHQDDDDGEPESPYDWSHDWSTDWSSERS